MQSKIHKSKEINSTKSSTSYIHIYDIEQCFNIEQFYERNFNHDFQCSQNISDLLLSK